MKNILTQYNTTEIMKGIGNLEGVNIMIDDVWIKGVTGLGIEYNRIDADIPEEAKDGSEEANISIVFDMGSGRVSVTFCPDRQICEVWHEQKDLLIFRIQDTSKYLEQEREHLNFMESEYKEYMSKWINGMGGVNSPF